jgi:hypothetical protein
MARLLATCRLTTGSVMPTKLIEVALPLDVINREAAREKSIRHGHPSTLHLWWARRPLAACRAVLFAQLVDDPSAHPESFPTEADQERERRRLFTSSSGWFRGKLQLTRRFSKRRAQRFGAATRRTYRRLLTHSAVAARSRSKRSVSVSKRTRATSTPWLCSLPRR